METDVAAAAWGEYTGGPWGPGRLVFVTVGTGIGAAAILDDKIVRHTHGGAGHLGQMIVDSSEDAPLGPCGTRGSLEACASGPALERAAEAAGLPASLARLDDQYQQGNARAMAIVLRAARFLAIGLVNIAWLYAPDVVVVGGGAAAALPRLVPLAASAAEGLRGGVVPRSLAVHPAWLGDNAGMIGAALLAAERRPER
jgi:glucokinase